MVNTYSYEPYGKLARSTGSVSNPWLYAGGYLDASTGIYKFGMRYYDPSVARWSQVDPQPGPNLYSYSGDNPVNNVDPSGGDWFWGIVEEFPYGFYWFAHWFDCGTGSDLAVGVEWAGLLGDAYADVSENAPINDEGHWGKGDYYSSFGPAPWLPGFRPNGQIDVYPTGCTYGK